MHRALFLRTAVSLSLCLAPLTATPTRAQDAPEIRITSDAIQVGIGGRFHTQFNTTSVDSEPGSELFIRRARIELGVKLNELVSGAIHPEFGGDRVTLKDAYMRLDFSPALGVLAGKAYKPFSRIEQTSSTRILTIERGAAIRGLDALDEYEIVHGLEYSDRDVGVQVMGRVEDLPLSPGYRFGVFQGPLHGAVGNVASYQYAAQATVQPLKSLSVGGAWSSRHFARELPDSAGFDLGRGHAFEIDAEIGSFAPGLHVIGEIAWGDADPLRDAGFFGAHLWAAFRTERVSSTLSAIEPVFRVSYGDVDERARLGTGVTLLTPGINVYFVGRNRLMFNYDVFLPHDRDAVQTSFKTMFSLAF